MKKLLILSVLLTCWQFVTAQQVNGTIMDGNQGEALIGATILEKGTDNGTITDLDGNFTLDVSTENPVIEISFIGYATQEISYDGSPITLSLFEDAQTLDEIVVVGYGVQKKKVVTGAVAQVKAEALEDKQIVNVQSALQGRTAGVTVVQGSGQPGSGSLVRIRGLSNLGSGNAPVYIVDGLVVAEAGINDLNPNDIESIDVLKDGAGAIYGVSAAGGVVLITTKQGRKGFEVNYSGSYGIQNVARKIAVTNATEYAILRNESSAAAGGPILFEDPQALGVGTDWQDEVFRSNAPMANHNLSLSAGNDKSTYFSSIGYTTQEGIVSADKSKYQRFNLRFNSTHEITDRIKITTNIGYTKNETKGIGTNSEFGSPLSRALNLDPITPVYETDEQELSEQRYQQENILVDENGIYGISEYAGSETLNPVAALSIINSRGYADKFLGTGTLEFSLTDYLKFTGRIGVDRSFWGGESFNPVFYLNAANRLDLNTYGRNLNNGTDLLGEAFLNFEKDFNGHELELTLGHSAQRATGGGIGLTLQNIPVDNLEDASLAWPTTQEQQSPFGYEYEGRKVSYFGKLNYEYKEKYLLGFIMRRDGTVRFGENKRFGLFPSVLFGWNVSDEGFFPATSMVNYLKIRGSYGILGNDNIGDFRYLARIDQNANYTFGEGDNLVIGSTPGVLSNPDLRWETTNMFNIGLDAKLFKNVTLALDFYKRKTEGLLGDLSLPRLVGFGNPVGNISTLQNQGFEIELGFEKSKNEFEYAINTTFGYNQNQVLFITDELDFLPGFRFGPSGVEMTRTSVDEPVGYLFGYKTDGLFQNQEEIDAYVNAEGELLLPDAVPGDVRFVDLDGDGDVDPDDRTKLGNGYAPISYGIDINLFWKSLDFKLFGSGVAGNEIFNTTRRFDLNSSNYPVEALERWTGEGTSNSFPRLTDNDRNMNFSRSSDLYLEDADFFKLRNVQIGYNLSEELQDKFNVGASRFYVAVNNLYTFTKYSGFEPEIIGNVDRGQYPQPRVYLVGLNVKFNAK